MTMHLKGIVRALDYEVDWGHLKRLLDSGADLKKAVFQPEADPMTLAELLDHAGSVQDLDEAEQDTYMKLAAIADPVSWDNMVDDFDMSMDYEQSEAMSWELIVNARLAREAINFGREAEILSLRTDIVSNIDVTYNILDAALIQCSNEFFHRASPEFHDYVVREYLCEPPKQLCLELVKLGMKPLFMESILDQQCDIYWLHSAMRASYIQAAFDAGLLQDLRNIRRDQQELFLTDLPKHIVLAINDDCAMRSGPEDLSVFRGMVEGMMTHGLSTRFAIKNILTCIKDNYEVPCWSKNPSRVQERRTSFLKEWRKREIGFSMQRMAMLQKFLAQVNRPLLPSSVLHMIDSFLLGDYQPVLDHEVGNIFEF